MWTIFRKIEFAMPRTQNITAREARKTALIVAGALAAAAVFFYSRGRMSVSAVSGGLAIALVVTGAFLPALAILFHRGWMGFAHALGYVNSRILLTLVYFLIFVPYGIISRLAARDPLDIRSSRTSYWTRRKFTRQPKERFERLF